MSASADFDLDCRTLPFPAPAVKEELFMLTRSNLRASTVDGAAYGVMVGTGETYIAAFALAVGLGEVSAGLVSSVPLLAGGILQLISLRAVQWVGSEKRWVVICAMMQGLAFLPLIYAALVGSASLWSLLLVGSLYWAGGLAGGPAWNTWMEVIVPARLRAHYFAKRTRLSQFMVLLGLIGGGFFLQYAKSIDRTLLGFASLFLLAFVFRMASVYWLARHQTPRDASRITRSVKAMPSMSSSAADRARDLSGKRLLVYLVMVQGMVQISGPYFASYMLDELQFSYGMFVAMLAISYIAKVTALSGWAHIAKHSGAKALLWIGGCGLVPLSSLWIVSPSYYWIAFVQLVSGTLWAAYELGFFLMFFEAIPMEKRTRLLTYYNLANTSAWCAGALIGGALLKYFDSTASGYYLLFAVSSLGRLAALGILASTTLQSVPVLKIAVRVLGIRPAAGTLDSPILPSIEPEPVKAAEAADVQSAAA